MRSKRFLSALILCSVCGRAAPLAAKDVQLGRGHRWVRSHPFTTMALTITRKLDARQYRQANMTALLAWKARDVLLQKAVKEGLPWQMHIYPHRQGLTEKLKANIKRLYDTYPGCTGWMVWDEPKRGEMFVAAPTLAWLRKTYPHTLVYSNAYPHPPQQMYGGKIPGGQYTCEQYQSDFVNIMKADVLSYDVYPFQEGTGKLRPIMFLDMAAARTVGLERKVPYWTFVQSYAHKPGGVRMPSESDVRMQVFAHLTYGFTGITYFTYWSMVEGGRRPIYYHVARLNMEVRNVGQALRFLTSTDVGVVFGGGDKLRFGTKAWSPGAGDERITAVTVADRTPGDYKDVLLGFFRDDSGRRYLMVTNLWHGRGASAADRRMTVTLHMDRSVRVVGRLSRETGTPELLRVSDGKLTLTLPGGTGELLRFGDAKFPGLSGR